MDAGSFQSAIIADAPPKRAKEPKVEIALIGYQDQGNLGLGYLAAVVERRGWTARLYDIRDDAASLARELQARKPLIVGFSLIFQFFLPRYRKVAQTLRAAGIDAHPRHAGRASGDDASGALIRARERCELAGEVPALASDTGSGRVSFRWAANGARTVEIEAQRRSWRVTMTPV